VTRTEDKELVERLERAEHSRAAYARALAKMRDMLIPVHDELEDEGDRVYLGSTNHAELIHEAWHLADSLKWDEILADTQPKTPLAQINFALQERIASLETELAQLRSGDEEETYEIGKRDGYGKAVQDIDLLTGGDGEYCYCMNAHDSERHCPDAEAMKARIADRFNELRSGEKEGL
jgi:hypothetical protein